MCHVWDYTFGPDKMGINPKECKILLTEPPMNPTKNREKMIEVSIIFFSPEIFYKFSMSFATLHCSNCIIITVCPSVNSLLSVNIEGSKSDVAMNTWPPQASGHCDNLSDTCCRKYPKSKGSIDGICLLNTVIKPASALRKVYVLPELAIVGLPWWDSTLKAFRYNSTDGSIVSLAVS